MAKSSKGFLVSGMFMGSLLLHPLGVQALAGGDGDLEKQVRDLVKQNRNLQNRLQEVEEKLVEMKKGKNANTGMTETKGEIAGTGFFSELESRISFSGLVEFGGAWQEVEEKSGEQDDESDLSMTTVELAIGAEVNPWVNLETVLLYEDAMFDPGESSLDVDVAAVTLGNTEEFPLYLTVGKMYVPFGALLTHLPDDPLIDSPTALAMGEASEKAVLLGLDYKGFIVSGYAFNGDVEEEGDDNHIDGYGFDINYSASFPISRMERITRGEKYPHGITRNMDLLVGASYISNITESDGLTEAIAEEIKEYVPGCAAYLHAGYRGFFLDAEYMTAADEYEPAELISEGRGAQPAVWNFETGFNYDWGRNLEVVFKYAGSDEAEGLGFPEKRYGVGFNQEIYENTVFSLGYLNDSYEDEDIDGRDERDLLFTQLAVEF